MKRKLLIKAVAAVLSVNLLFPGIPLEKVNAASNSIVATEKKVIEEKKETTKEVIDRLMKTLTIYYGETSVQYALMDNGEIVYSGSEGYADKENKKAPTKDTIYCLASISKVYTTAAVMKLVDEGKINLDTPVVEYVPEFTMKDDRYKDITVRMLLNHSSGLLGTRQKNSILLGDVDQSSKEGLLDYLKTQRLAHAPGEYSVYCNDGFTLAEIVVEHVTNQTFTQYLHNNIFQPVKAKNTYTASEKIAQSRYAGIYDTTGSKLPYENFGFIGAAGVYSTAEDVCKFSQTFMKDNNQILSEESIQATKNEEYKRGVYQEDDEATLTYGLGWDNVSVKSFEQYGIKALVKGGDSIYYHSGLTVLPDENISIAILSVGGASTYNEIVAEQILLHYLEETKRIEKVNKFENPLASLKTASMPVELQEFSGYYANLSEVMEIDVKPGKLELTLPQMDVKFKFKYLDDSWFYNDDMKIYFRLFKDKSGRSYIYIKQLMEYPQVTEGIVSLYYAQKLDDYEVNEEALNAWKERCGKSYVVVSEKYSSYFYSIKMGAYTLPKKEELFLDKYYSYLRVIDENHLQMDLQIPMQYGRDLKDFEIVKEDGVEYLLQNDLKLMDMSVIKNLSSKKQSSITIPSNGYAQYYKIPSKLAGKKLSINVPKNAAFIVYDDKGNLCCNSYLEHTTKAKLPKKGYIAFVGDVGATFTIKTVK